MMTELQWIFHAYHALRIVAIPGDAINLPTLAQCNVKIGKEHRITLYYPTQIPLFVGLITQQFISSSSGLTSRQIFPIHLITC
jgi:hypothetical protein